MASFGGLKDVAMTLELRTPEVVAREKAITHISLSDLEREPNRVNRRAALSPLNTTMKASTSAASTSAPVAHNALPPPTTSSATRSSRIAPHSHIKGLGLAPEGHANIDGQGS